MRGPHAAKKDTTMATGVWRLAVVLVGLVVVGSGTWCEAGVVPLTWVHGMTIIRLGRANRLISLGLRHGQHYNSGSRRAWP